MTLWCVWYSAVQSGSLLIDSSTIDPAASQDMEKQAASKGAVYMDSPVSGGTPYTAKHLSHFITWMFYNILVGSFLKGCLHNSTQLNSARQREQQLTQFVGCDVINKNTTDLAVCCSTGSVEFSWVELCRYKHPFSVTSTDQKVCHLLVAFFCTISVE